MPAIETPPGATLTAVTVVATVPDTLNAPGSAAIVILPPGTIRSAIVPVTANDPLTTGVVVAVVVEVPAVANAPDNTGDAVLDVAVLPVTLNDPDAT